VQDLLKRIKGRLKRSLSAGPAPITPEIAEKVRTANDPFFARLGVDQQAVRRRYRELSDELGLRSDNDESVHRLAFTALQMSGFRPLNILELGTLHGAATTHLATLFPEAVIHTVELPADDPLLAQWHQDSAKRDAEMAQRFARYPNIRQIRANTFDLAALDLPLFDLIWLDAGHHYPEVAWDHAYCLGRLRAGGWLLSDDIIVPDAQHASMRDEDFAPYRVIEYVKARKSWANGLLLKRENPARYLKTLKYIAWFHKNIA
jgi:predicted O-methyltransferase YrrM